MNAKAKLLEMVANMTEESCQKVLLRIYEKIGIGLATTMQIANEGEYLAVNSATFVESEHPRDEDGKFTDKSGGGKKPTQEKTRQQLKSDIRRAEEIFKETESLESRTTGVESLRKPLLGGHSMKYINDLTKFQLAKEELRKHELNELSDKMTKLAKEYRDVDEEIDVFEEAYADRGPDGDGIKLKWPNTDEAKADRKKYKKLLRRKEELSKRIDWKYVKDEEK